MEIISIITKSIDFSLVWQTIIGSVGGVVVPLFVLWCAEKYKERKQTRKYLYYLQRIIVDQINAVVEIQDTATKFLDLRLSTLLNNIESSASDAYSVDGAFFPLFSVRSITDDVNSRSSGSGYIDNKVAKIYAMSKDMPHIIDDIRMQLRDTLERNEKIAFGKMNSAKIQKEQYKMNIKEYAKMVREDLLNKSTPIYLRKLAETLVAVELKSNLTNIRWKIRFDPAWKFYFFRTRYLKARSEIMEEMDAYFKIATEEKLKELDKLKS